MRIRVAAHVAVSVVLLSSASVVWAQETEPQVSPEPAVPQGTTTLPEVVVEASDEQQAAPQKKKKASSSSQIVTQSANAEPQAPPPVEAVLLYISQPYALPCAAAPPYWPLLL